MLKFHHLCCPSWSPGVPSTTAAHILVSLYLGRYWSITWPKASTSTQLRGTGSSPFKLAQRFKNSPNLDLTFSPEIFRFRIFPERHRKSLIFLERKLHQNLHNSIPEPSFDKIESNRVQLHLTFWWEKISKTSYQFSYFNHKRNPRFIKPIFGILLESQQL